MVNTTEFRHLLLSGVFSIIPLIIGCADSENTPTGPSSIDVSDEYLFVWQFLDVFFIFREDLPADPYAFQTPQHLYLSVNEPYTRYYPPDSLDHINSSLSTRKSGMGIMVDSVTNGYVVTDVFSRSPAQQAGVQVGDIILSINGQSLAGISFAELPDLLGGQVGDQKRLRIGRDQQQITVTVILDEFHSPSVFIDSVDEATAYIRITSFLNNTIAEGGTAEEFDSALQNTRWAENTILDLRNNPGGELEQCIRVTSEFLQDSTPLVTVRQRVLISEERAEGRTEELVWRSSPEGGDARGRNFYVLQNNTTASASEILIVSLNQYRPEVRTIGSTTFGKARGQVLGVTPDSGIARVTYATISPVQAPDYDVVGISPEIAVESQSALDVALQLSRESTARKTGSSGSLAGRVALMQRLYNLEGEPILLVRRP
ncbi:MAG: S41 family peptidase [Chitinispirillaceae bacterium]